MALHRRRTAPRVHPQILAGRSWKTHDLFAHRSAKGLLSGGVVFLLPLQSADLFAASPCGEATLARRRRAHRPTVSRGGLSPAGSRTRFVGRRGMSEAI